jgi:hypothetical protein
MTRSTFYRILQRSILISSTTLASWVLFAAGATVTYAQSPITSVQRGSQIAKAGFKNEDEITDKFNNWRADADARAWLATMNYKLQYIESVSAAKPHGKKADVIVRIRINQGQKQILDKVEGVSIKLVSSPHGFNQIDKRWLTNYARMWRMPPDVVAALKLYLGETTPNTPSKNANRMFLNEIDPAQKKAVIDFFTENRAMIVSDLIEGDGADSAKWMMVAFKATDRPRWVIKSSADAVRFFGEGKVEMTSAGNLRIGRITMQRKGGDGGRDTANMLQFKINPVSLFEAK